MRSEGYCFNQKYKQDSALFSGDPIASQGPVSSMLLSPVTEDVVASVVQMLNSKQSCDINGVSTWVLKRCYKHLLTPLEKLINTSYATGTCPNTLKTAKVTPIKKRRSLPNEQLSNYINTASL